MNEEDKQGFSVQPEVKRYSGDEEGDPAAAD
jgi:hypothetical protein